MKPMTEMPSEGNL